MRPILVTSAVIAALGLGGCGAASSAGKFKGEEETVATVIEDLQRDGERGKADQICDDVFTEALQERVKAGDSSCASELKKALDDADTFDLEVKDVSVTGTTATAEVEGADEGDGVQRTLKLEKVGDTWRIDSLGDS